MQYKIMIEKLNDTVYCELKPSDIEGVGVFAIRDIPANKCFCEKINDYINIREEDFSFLEKEVFDLIKRFWGITKDTTTIKSTNDQVEFKMYLNHSSNANTDGFKTLREIKKGEELTINYCNSIPNTKQIKEWKFI